MEEELTISVNEDACSGIDGLAEPGLTLLDPYTYGWPVIGPIQNLRDNITDEREQGTLPSPLTDQFNIDDYENSMDVESFSRVLGGLPHLESTQELSTQEFGLNRFGTKTAGGGSTASTPRDSLKRSNRSVSETLKRSMYGSPASEDESTIPTIENPHLVDIECDVEIGGELYPLQKTWDLSTSESYSLNNDIYSYARHVSLELGLPSNEEMVLVASIRGQLKTHVDRLVNMRKLQYEDKYGNQAKSNNSLAKDLVSEVGDDIQSDIGGQKEEKRKEGDKKKSASSTAKEGETSKKEKPQPKASQAPKRKEEAPKWVEILPEDHNTDICGLCFRGGDLLCCDRCPRAFHLDCLKVKEEDLPDGDWICDGCHADDRQFAEHPLLLACPSEQHENNVYELASQLLELVSSHDFSPPFLDPLDTEALGVSVKYDEVVKYRMDLCEVKRRLDDSLEMTRDVSGKMPAYTALQFVKDVRTVWHNCIIFNAEGSAIARMAKHLSKMFETGVTQRLVVGMCPESVASLSEHTASLKEHSVEIQHYWRETLGMAAQSENKVKETESKVVVVKKREKKKRPYIPKKARAPPVDKSSMEPQPWLGTISLSASKATKPRGSPGRGATSSEGRALKFESDSMVDTTFSPLSPLQPLSRERRGTPSKPTDKIKRTKGVKASPVGSPEKRSNCFSDDSDFESPLPRKRGRPRKTPPTTPIPASSSSTVASPAVTSSKKAIKPKSDTKSEGDHRSSPRVRDPHDTGGSLGPNRETREARQWKEVCALGVAVGNIVFKDFGRFGIFKGKVTSVNYPFVSIKYEDNDVEDLEPAEFLRTMNAALQAKYRDQYYTGQKKKK